MSYNQNPLQKFDKPPSEWEYIDPDPDGWNISTLRSIAFELNINLSKTDSKKEIMEKVVNEING